MKSAFQSHRSSIVPIILIIAIALMIRTFGYGLYRVPSQSMETTMLVGEFFFADKFCILFWPPVHGDIVAFNDPTYAYSNNKLINLFQRVAWGPSNWTKRVVGIPGDHVRGVIENGRSVVYRNKIKLNEPYANQHRHDVQEQKSNGIDEFDVQLGYNEYWVMGDNRGNSYDSRSFGPLNGILMHGKIIFRIASTDNDVSLWKAIVHPMNFAKSIRWDRCAQRVV